MTNPAHLFESIETVLKYGNIDWIRLDNTISATFQNHILQDGYNKFNSSFVSLLEFTENTEALKTKMSELRLYCNLLVQQVHKTKEASISGVSEPEVQLYFCCRPHL